jgi:membrane fusion protein, multidrug efflux system
MTTNAMPNAQCPMLNATRDGVTQQLPCRSTGQNRFAFCILHLALLACLASAACTNTEAEKASEPTAPATVRIGAENVVAVKRDTVVTGPIISGELQAARDATIRAELGGSVVEVNVEAGQAVRAGTLLGRIDAQTLEDARQSTASAVRSAENQLAVAQRERERAETLVKAGAVAERELDMARNSVSTAEAQLADARSRLVNATKQLGDAIIRSPINGVVARRSVNRGDVVTVGSELFVVIDPSSMRLEASVPSESLGELKIGATVDFQVRGYDQRFQGRIERISPLADPTTRQVPIYVTIPNDAGRLVAGLFAEGRVITQTAEGLVVPLNAVNTSGQMPWALRVNAGKTERIDVQLGVRDPRTERAQITSGVKEGDMLLRGAAQGITPGTPVTVSVPQ